MEVLMSGHLFGRLHRIEMYMDRTFSCHYLTRTDYSDYFDFAVAAAAADVAVVVVVAAVDAGLFVDSVFESDTVSSLVVLEIIG